MRTGVDSAPGTSEVLAIEQLGPGLVPRTARPAVQLQSAFEPITYLRPVIVHHGVGARRQSTRPVRRGGSGELLERNQGGARGLDLTATDRTLDEVRSGKQCDAGMGLAVTMREQAAEASVGLLGSAQRELQQSQRPVSRRGLEPKSSRRGNLENLAAPVSAVLLMSLGGVQPGQDGEVPADRVLLLELPGEREAFGRGGASRLEATREHFRQALELQRVGEHRDLTRGAGGGSGPYRKAVLRRLLAEVLSGYGSPYQVTRLGGARAQLDGFATDRPTGLRIT